MTRYFPPSQRGQAMGLQGMMTYCSLMLGPVLGGWITDHIGWRFIFYINIPVCLVAIGVAALTVPHDEPEAKGERFDFPGALMFVAALVALILALNQGHAWGWMSLRVLALLGAFAVLLASFVRREGRTTHPMLDLTLFHRRKFTATAASGLLNYMCVNVLIFLMPFYLIQGRHMTPSMTGMVYATQPLIMMIMAPIAGTLGDRFGPRGISTLGMALVSCGLFMASRLSATSSVPHIVAAMMTVGLGTGIFVAPNNAAMMGAAPANRRGIAGGVLATARNAGMVLGVGFSGAIFTTILARETPAAIFDGVSAGLLFGACAALIGCVTSLVKSRPQDDLECR